MAAPQVAELQLAKVVVMQFLSLSFFLPLVGPFFPGRAVRAMVGSAFPAAEVAMRSTLVELVVAMHMHLQVFVDQEIFRRMPWRSSFFCWYGMCGR